MLEGFRVQVHVQNKVNDDTQMNMGRTSLFFKVKNNLKATLITFFGNFFFSKTSCQISHY
jgi:hypothetical protein